MRAVTQIEVFGKVLIHPGSMIIYLRDSGVYLATVKSVCVEDNEEFYLLDCSCGKCPTKKISIHEVIEVFGSDDIYYDEPLINKSSLLH